MNEIPFSFQFLFFLSTCLDNKKKQDADPESGSNPNPTPGNNQQNLINQTGSDNPFPNSSSEQQLQQAKVVTQKSLDAQQPSTSNAQKQATKRRQDAPPPPSDVTEKTSKQKQNAASQQSKSSGQHSSTTNTQKKAPAPKQGAPKSSKVSIQQQNIAQPTPAQDTTTNMPHLLCPYKGPGTRGLKFKSLLETNYLKLMINNMKDFAYHYDVVIEPDKPKKHMTKVFQQFCRNNFPSIGIAFDGSRNAYAPMRLSLDNVEREVDFTHPDTNNVRKYLVNIKETDDMEIPLKSLKT